MRGGRGVTFAGWKPALRETQDDIGDAWDAAAARVADMIQNNGWLSGAIDQAVANTVGTGLRMKAIPENETFGMTSSEASAWAKTVERRFELWSRNAQECDIQGLRTFGQMQSAAFRSWLIT
ncbi:MAG: phage portal protein, partial [Thioalkalivibrio sp.]|nr:phage portal protein [Thioalkalivibrio sp.]